jgi:hypothetical protein
MQRQPLAAARARSNRLRQVPPVQLRRRQPLVRYTGREIHLGDLFDPEFRLDRVPSGSGEQFSNGVSTLTTNGDEALLDSEGARQFSAASANGARDSLQVERAARGGNGELQDILDRGRKRHGTMSPQCFEEAQHVQAPASPGFRPRKRNSGRGVVRSLPRSNEGRNSAVAFTHTRCATPGSSRVARQPSRKYPVSGA